MDTRVLKISREQLYEKAWTTPMRRLAREMGLSDVGLAKLCRRNQIPVPGLGYWRRLETGHKPARPPLPAREGPGLDLIEIVIREGSIDDIGQTSNPDAPDASLAKEAIKIVVSDDELITHSFAIRTRKTLAHGRKDERGILFPKEGRASHLKVSEAALPRALRILDALLRAMEEQKYLLNWPKDEAAKLTVVVLGEKLQFTISEVVEQKTHTQTQQEIARQKLSPWDTPRKWDYHPTGNLRVSIEDVPYGIRHSWGDGKKQRTEDCLVRFIASLSIAAQAFKREREERERKLREREEQRKREEEHRQLSVEYARKAEVIRKLAREWHDAKLIRSFLKAFTKACGQLSRTQAGKRETQLFIEWATKYADGEDPLSSVALAMRELRGPSKQYGF